MKNNILYIFFALCIFILSSCVTTKDRDLSSEDSYSKMPWNQPAGWEDKGRLGGLLPQNR